MINFDGYRLIEQVYSSARVVVYRGERESDQTPVAIKILNSEYPSTRDILQFRSHYMMTKLHLPGVAKTYSLLHDRNGFALVMEFGGKPLPQEWTLSDFFDVALQMTEILAGLYVAGIIHKAIKPQHFLINSEQQVKLIDFGIASLLPKEAQVESLVLAETLAYISPEQTGRMNRGVDYRSDFYSLGVTFYELLTGRLPFESTDPLELVHCHIARLPTPPRLLNPAIPIALNDIVLKLMAKTAQERYQTAFGLKHDLEKCRHELTTGSIQYFTLGDRDICDRFLIPEKLYGRSEDVATILATFARVSAGAKELILVAGFCGIGKTALVQEVHIPILKQRGYFIKGKFDQLQRHIPAIALIQALQNLIKQLLTETQAQLQNWKTYILLALGDNGQVIVDVLPELELLIGKQAPVRELTPSAAEHRFRLLFTKFIQIFATSAHPLVIFIDDLQWADSASLKLLQLLLTTADTTHLLVIGAYRDHEVGPIHPLMLTLTEIQQNASLPVNQINLAPLDRQSLNHLIADTLSCPPELAMPLTAQVFQKTQGNPFFSHQFLQSLHADGLIFFNCGWQCDLGQIKQRSLRSDVVEFMATVLQKLPDSTQNVLKLAACIGNEFDLTTSAIVSGKSTWETAADLWPALVSGLVIPTNEIYKFYQGNDITIEQNYQSNYKFLHDRVQQAAYSLIPENQKQSTHYQIGQLLWQNTPPAQINQQIFEIVNQLNYGINLITQVAKRQELAELNLAAGRKAKSATAYVAAAQYLAAGIKLLSNQSWLHQYDLTLALFETATEVAYLNGTPVEDLAAIVLQRAHTLLDKIKVYEIKIQAYAAESQPQAAVLIALQVLHLLGIKFPQKPDNLRILWALLQTKLMLPLQISELVNLPEMTDPHQLAIMRVMRSVGSPAYQATPWLMPLIAFKGVNLSLKYGNTAESAYAYASYGVILCGVLGDVAAGYQFGKLAMQVLARFQAKELTAKTLMVVTNFINHWQDHVNQGLKPLLDAYQIGLETGDLEFAAYALYIRAYHAYFVGQELSGLEQEILSYSQAISQFKQAATQQFLGLYRQVALNLLGAENPCSLIGESYNEEVRLPLAIQANHQTEIFDIYFHKLILCYLFQQYDRAVDNADMALKYLDAARASLSVPLFHFYDSLAQLGLYNTVEGSQQQRILRRVRANQQKMRKWAQQAPMNHQHKFELVTAEYHRVQGQHLLAMAAYDRAIAKAKENGYINEESIAWELAGKFYLGWGKSTIAQTYLTNAYYAYTRWGAKAKVTNLAKSYPFLHPQPIVATQSTFDTETLIKAGSALFGEIPLESLLSTLMQVLIQNTGAQKGALFLLEGNQRRLVVTREIDTHSQIIPENLLNYVQHTQETLVIDDLSADVTFAGTSAKSVLCTPMINQERLLGILYLENNLTTAAFSRDRLAILKILTSLAAISIENSRLIERIEDYSHTLEIKVQQRTQELQQLTEELQQTVLAADAANRAKSEFLANMSHELRTPLNAILGFSQIMSQEALSPTHHENITIINRAGEHLLGLINEIIEISRIEAGNISFNESSFNLLELLDSIEKILRLKTQNRDLQLVFEYASDLPRYVRTDESKLRQVLLTLFKKAVKFTEKGSVTLRISRRLSSLHFEIEDTGTGIAEADLLSTTTQSDGHKYQPVGLGLRISRKYVQIMGGDIHLKNTLRQGSLLTFEIPIRLEASVDTTYLQPQVTLAPQPKEQVDWDNYLSQMPAVWVKQVHSAACSGSDAQLFALIAQIPPQHTSFKNALSDLTNNFQFEMVMQLTQELINHHPQFVCE